ncbi:hypothetical protein LIER_26119 [Lithospermum erythrorhizon]|uniref:Uncharacterized protein n=1 Tax=Lithospermum erythrorhizon TaxID=34254 RepID=A0AAV3RAM4_LITER
MCSSGSVFLVNLVKVGSFNPAGMMAPLRKGPALLTRYWSPVEFVEQPCQKGHPPVVARLPYHPTEEPVLLCPLPQLHGDSAAP